MEKNFCEKCRGTGIIKEKDGSIHTCFDCLISGRMDQHEVGGKSASEVKFKW